MKIIFYIFLLLLLGCQPKNDLIDSVITTELNKNESVGSIFLNLKIKTPKSDVNQILSSSDKITLNDDEYFYEFINEENLNGLRWRVNPTYHNDSLMGVRMTAYRTDWYNGFSSMKTIYDRVANL